MENKLKRSLGLMLAILMLCALAVGCARTSKPTETTGNGETSPSATAAENSGEATGNGRADTLTVVLPADPSNMDPSTDIQTHFQVVRQIYETLFVYDENYVLQPWLCESYEYEDAHTILFHLRKGVYFHNGDELKASDVDFTFKRIYNENLPAIINFAKVNFEESGVVDDYTYRLVTNGDAPTQIKLLEHPACAILSERAYTEANGDWNNGATCGTGAFEFVSYSPGDQVVLEANDNYWREGEPHFNNLIFRVIVDSSSRAIEAETGGADIVYDIKARDIETVSAAPNVKMVTELGTNTSYLLFNYKQAPLDNDLVRQAIWYGVDVDAAVALAYGDFGARATDWCSPGILGGGFESVISLLPQRDVEKAKQCLAEAGYAEGELEIEISVTNAMQDRCDMAEAFQAQLAEVGINVKINIMEDSAWLAYCVGGNSQLSIYGFSAVDLEADRPLSCFIPPNTNSNTISYLEADFQDVCARAFAEMDDDARAQLYSEAMIMMLEDHVTLPLWHKELNAAVQQGIEGFRISRSFEQHYLQYVYRAE